MQGRHSAPLAPQLVPTLVAFDYALPALWSYEMTPVVTWRWTSANQIAMQRACSSHEMDVCEIGELLRDAVAELQRIKDEKEKSGG